MQMSAISCGIKTGYSGICNCSSTSCRIKIHALLKLKAFATVNKRTKKQKIDSVVVGTPTTQLLVPTIAPFMVTDNVDDATTHAYFRLDFLGSGTVYGVWQISQWVRLMAVSYTHLRAHET